MFLEFGMAPGAGAEPVDDAVDMLVSSVFGAGALDPGLAAAPSTDPGDFGQVIAPILDGMARSVDLARLGELLPGYRFAYLVTVGDDYRVRTTAITPTFDGSRVDIGPVGSHGRENMSARNSVTLVWPARKVSEYSLFVDGRAEVPDDPSAPVLVTPTKALLHRPVFADGRAVGTAHDCVQLKAD